MNHRKNILADGTSTQDQPIEEWARALREVADAGFTSVDPVDSWLRLADLSPSRLDDFMSVVGDAGLGIPSLSTSRRSVIDPEHGAEYLEYSHRVIDTAVAVGATVVSFGLFRELLPLQQEALWFWTVQGAQDPDDQEVWDLAVARIRELARHADEVGIDISLEMYEDTYLGTADSAVRFVTDVDHPRAGLNPDLGNLVRLHRPVERWESMARKTLPLANFWHVKNYFRMEDASSDFVATSPAPLELGVINYREAIRIALESGFHGPIVTEHYGGDSLSVCATNRRYLRGILSAADSSIGVVV